MEETYWKHFFKYHFFIFKILGIFPKTKSFFESHLNNVHFFITNIIIMGLFNLSLTVQLILNANDIKLFSETAYITLMCIIANLKATLFILNWDQICKYLELLDAEELQPKNQKQKRIIEDAMKAWYNTFYVFLIGCSFLVPMYWIVPIISHTKEENFLPFVAWYPYYEHQPIYYTSLYIYQCVGFTVVVYHNIFIDTFISLMMSYVGAQCDLLAHRVRNIEKYTMERLQIENPEEDLKLFQAELSKSFLVAVQQHYIILDLAACLNKFINVIVFTLYFISCITMTFSMFNLSVLKPGTPLFLTTLMYQIGVTGELFIYCWFGNEVIIKSKAISDAPSKSDWWKNSSLIYRKNMLFFILRTQKPIRLLAMSFFEISLSSFTTIIRTTWSYYALLRQVYSRNSA